VAQAVASRISLENEALAMTARACLPAPNAEP